jgi:hypothetical protein
MQWITTLIGNFTINQSIKNYIGPSRVSALPLAAGINVGGHYKWQFGPGGVRALPLVAGINAGGHYKLHFFLPSPPPLSSG